LLEYNYIIVPPSSGFCECISSCGRCGRNPHINVDARNQHMNYYAFIYSNWVIVSKFAMVQSNHRLRGGKIIYNLLHSSLKQIKVTFVKNDHDIQLEDDE
jgi:hypothetical protein